MTPYPITVYRHGADLSLCYPLMWNITLDYTITHFNVLGQTRPGNPFPTFHTHQRTHNLNNAFMVVVSQKLGRKCTALVYSLHHQHIYENDDDFIYNKSLYTKVHINTIWESNNAINL